MATWIIDSTLDCLQTDDQIPLGKMRARMRRDAVRWAQQGLTFEGVRVDRDPTSSIAQVSYVVTGAGYSLRMQKRRALAR